MLKQSVMSGKLTGIPAYNTNTKSNEFCMRQKNTDTICGQCYSHKMLDTYRKSCIPAWQRNSDQFADWIEWDDLPRDNDLFVRLNGHGELINDTHFVNIIRLARKNPQTTYALWTKRASITRKFTKPYNGNDFGDIPDNLILVFSNPSVDNVIDVPRGFHKVFNNVSKGSTEPQNCTGKKCMECLACYRKDSGTDVIVEMVK
jgi:hypothetical protein